MPYASLVPRVAVAYVCSCVQSGDAESTLEAFDLICAHFPHIEAFRGKYLGVVRQLRSMLTVREKYERPRTSRGSHPFIQSKFPEIRRDKFEPGKELSMAEFVREAIRRPPPLEEEAKRAMADVQGDLAAAIDYICERGTQVIADRKERMLKLRRMAAELLDLRKALDACKSEGAQEIAGTFNVAWTAACMDAMGEAWPDKSLALHYVIGFPVVFDIPDSGVYKAETKAAEISPAEFMRGNTRMTAHIQRSLEKEAEGEDTDERAERRAQCWKKTKQETASGLVSKPRSKAQIDRKYGRGKWRPLRRSAIKQKGKWRCIDNGKASKHNKATTLHERLTCGRADFPVAMAREFGRRMSHGIQKRNRGRCQKKLRMEHGTEDLEAAYRHVPTSQPQFTIAAVWDDDNQRVCYIEVPGHNFGLSSAVLNFNRFPEFAVAIARRLLWIVVEHYVDDKDVTEPGWCRGTGLAALVDLFSEEFFGFPVAPDKHVEMAPENEYLGVESDLSQCDEGVLRMDVSRKRRLKLKEIVDRAMDDRSLKSGLAASLFGKARFMLSPVYGSMGKSCLQPILAREYQKGQEELTPEIEESLEFISFVCDHLPPLELPLLPFTGERVVIFTDAEGKKRKKGRPPSGHAGFVVYHPKYGVVHSYAAIPASVVTLMDRCKERQTYIGQFELIAAITPFISLPPEWFTGYAVELWIDNAGAVGSLIKGYSGVPDVARIINMFEFSLAKLGISSLYIDYVPTKSNPADVPSRAHELSARAAEASLAEFGGFTPMVLPVFADDNGNWLPFVEIAASVWGP